MRLQAVDQGSPYPFCGGCDNDRHGLFLPQRSYGKSHTYLRCHCGNDLEKIQMDSCGKYSADLDNRFITQLSRSTHTSGCGCGYAGRKRFSFCCKQAFHISGKTSGTGELVPAGRHHIRVCRYLLHYIKTISDGLC